MAGKAYTIPSIFTAIDRFTAPVRVMRSQMNSFVRTADVGLARIDRGFRTLMGPLNAVNKLLRYFGYFFGGAALVLGGAGVLRIITNFQQATADLYAVMTDANPALLKALADDAKRIGLTTARSATQVVGLQTELAKLGYTGPEILSMTKSIVAGSVAMDAALDRTATLGGAMVRTFSTLKATDMPMIMDQMTLATLDTALSFEKLETMLPIVSGAANAVHLPLSRVLALLGKLSDAGIDASSSATALRNIFIDSRRRGHSYDQVLTNIKKHADMLTPAFNKFGKRGAVSAVILADKLKEVAIEEQRLLRAQGTAAEVGQRRLNTIEGSWTLLKSAFSGFVLSLEDGTGKFATSLKKIIDVARGMVLLSAGTKDAMEAFRGLSPDVQKASEQSMRILGIIWKIIQALIVFKGVTIAARIALQAYSLWLGISAAAGWGSIFALRGNIIAMTTFRVVTWLGVAATEGLAFALRAVTFATGPVGIALVAIISLMDSLYRNWDDIGKAFETGGLWVGINKIAGVINDAIFYPIQRVFELLSGLPSFLGQYFATAAEGMRKIRRFNGTLVDQPQTKTPDERMRYWSPRSREVYAKYDSMNVAAQRSQADRFDDYLMKRGQSDFSGSLDVEFNAPPGFSARSRSDSVRVKGVRTTSTMGYGPGGN